MINIAFICFKEIVGGKAFKKAESTDDRHSDTDI